MTIAVCVRHLDYFFGSDRLRKQVLFDINLDVIRGEIVIMTGPSGSGKTTLLSLIGGLRSARSGSLRVLDRELCGASEDDLVRARRHNGYIFQGHNLHGSLTAIQNVQMGLEVRGQHDKAERLHRAANMLERVGLGDHLDYYPANLSGGQKQRVAVARALVSRPDLILADEPTAALDSKSGRDVVDILHDLAKQQGCTILLVTHDNRILDLADRIVHLEDGRLRDAVMA